MDSVRLALLAAAIGSVLLFGVYTGRGETSPTAVSPAPSAWSAPTANDDELPVGLDVPDALASLEELPSGLDIPTDLLEETSEPDVVDREARPRGPAPAPEPRRVARARTTRAPEPRRLDADPGRNVLLHAREMISRNETVRGSCYAYLTEVFARAGNGSWRTRTVVHQAGARGPYANLDQIRPGDWLYIVNSPDTTPVGTHSVLFVGWEDRGSGIARTISHAGWAAGPSAGRESAHDVSLTYRIIRPTLPR